MLTSEFSVQKFDLHIVTLHTHADTDKTLLLKMDTQKSHQRFGKTAITMINDCWIFWRCLGLKLFLWWNVTNDTGIFKAKCLECLYLNVPVQMSSNEKTALALSHIVVVWSDALTQWRVANESIICRTDCRRLNVIHSALIPESTVIAQRQVNFLQSQQCLTANWTAVW